MPAEEAQLEHRKSPDFFEDAQLAALHGPVGNGLLTKIPKIERQAFRLPPAQPPFYRALGLEGSLAHQPANGGVTAYGPIGISGVKPLMGTDGNGAMTAEDAKLGTGDRRHGAKKRQTDATDGAMTDH